MRRVLSASRYLILIAVIGAFIAAVALLIYGGIETVITLEKLVGGKLALNSSKAMAIKFIEIIDLYLIGTVFYITALGLYELFIDNQVPTPDWLHITHLDDLKSKLLGVMVVIMVVTFVAQLVNWDGERNLLGFGLAIGLVIAALTFFLSQGSKPHA
jgi:uncharacterized membrane protein YqhA